MGDFHAECSTDYLDEEEEPVGSDQSRSVNFADYTSKKIRGARNCAFSQLEHEELVQCLGLWYEACAQAMFHGNYSLIDQWVRRLGIVAANRGHNLEDFLELLRLCRNSAVEEFLSPVDAVINEAMRDGLKDTPWTIPANLDYVGTETANAPLVKNPVTAAKEKPERRVVERVSRKLPIRVFGNAITGYWLDLVLQTENVSRNGLYLIAYEPFSKEMPLQVICPYSTDPKVIQKKLSAKVVRVDRTLDKSRGIAIQLLEPLPLDASHESAFPPAR
jgi:hypothetical protein